MRRLRHQFLPIARLTLGARPSSLPSVSQSASRGPRRRTMASTGTLAEGEIKRNPHPDFKKTEASRPPWDGAAAFRYTQTVDPSWRFGQGANAAQHDGCGGGEGASSSCPPRSGSEAAHVCIDPYAEGRPAAHNYKLLISAVVPRPIAFVSTCAPFTAADGGGGANLAPFSYFQMINHDPPLFVIGFASALAGDRSKDTLRNLVDTGECVINIISEGFVEAANAASVNAPRGASEWAVAGLTPARDCADVGCPRVREAVFSVEGRLESVREFESRASPGRKTGTMAIIEGTRFWVREDAINEERNMVDPAVLRPISRLGGITYGRTTEAFELPRPDFQKDVGGQEGYDKLRRGALARGDAAADGTKSTNEDA